MRTTADIGFLLPQGEGQDEGGFTAIFPSPRPSPGGRGGKQYALFTGRISNSTFSLLKLNHACWDRCTPAIRRNTQPNLAIVDRRGVSCDFGGEMRGLSVSLRGCIQWFWFPVSGLRRSDPRVTDRQDGHCEVTRFSGHCEAAPYAAVATPLTLARTRECLPHGGCFVALGPATYSGVCRAALATAQKTGPPRNDSCWVTSSLWVRRHL